MNTLWARVIKAIHGGDGKIGKTVNHSFPSIWLNIIQEVDVLKSQDIDIASFIKPKGGDVDTKHRLDKSQTTPPIDRKISFPRESLI
ncbi:hypothetical protein Tco_0424358 [Tanacetum coccineum]